MPSPGQFLGDYTVLKRLAEGGMGEIFLGARLEPNGFAPPVVLKVLREELASDSAFVDMLVDEANIAMRLQHHNVVSVLDFGVHEETYFIAMEYVHGVPLQALLDAHRQRQVAFDIAVALHVAIELCSALDYAHGRRDANGEPLSIVHRDVTPGNVLIAATGEVKLTDFGLARAAGRTTHTMPGVLKGRFGYMAPEMLRYEQLDARADVFSAGIVFYEMLTGRHPTEGASIIEALGLFEGKKYPVPSALNTYVPPPLDQIILRALEAKPGSRWPSAAHLGHAIRALVEHWSAHWPDAAHGRARLATVMAMLFPELKHPPLSGDELESLLSEARSRSVSPGATFESEPNESAGWEEEANDATIVRSLRLSTLVRPVAPLSGELRIPVGAGPAAVNDTMVPTASSESFPPAAYPELEIPGSRSSSTFDLQVEAPVELELDSATGLTVAPPDRQRLLSRAAYALGEASPVDTCLEHMLDGAIAATNAELGVVAMRDSGENVTYRVARDASKTAVLDASRRVSAGILERVLADGTARAQMDAGEDAWVARQHAMGSRRDARPVLCTPMRTRGVTLGAVYLARPAGGAPFSEADADFCAALSTGAGLLVENDRLLRASLTAKAEPNREGPGVLRAGLIPGAMPDLSGWEVGVGSRLSGRIDGDFYDFIGLGPRGQGFVVARVLDREAPPGMFTAMARSTLRATLSHAASADEALCNSSRILGADARAGSSVSVAYVQIDPLSGDGVYVNAGHPPPLYFRASDGRLFSLAETGGALAIDVTRRIEQRAVRLFPGDFLLLTSPGVLAAQGPGSEPFGWNRLQKLVREHCYAQAADLAAAVESAVDVFVGSMGTFDDTTTLVVKRT